MTCPNCGHQTLIAVGSQRIVDDPDGVRWGTEGLLRCDFCGGVWNNLYVILVDDFLLFDLNHQPM